MNNSEFLDAVARAFKVFLRTGSRSNQKLIVLHSAIAADLAGRLGDGYAIKSLGFGEGKESEIAGRYFAKKVDLAIERGDEVVAGVGVKFIMQNYAQNSNNYFENMLGETANVRSGGTPYFQIFVVPDRLPYYDKRKRITHWEAFTDHHAEKYVQLSHDNPDRMLHTPSKTLLFVVHLPDEGTEVTDRASYVSFYAAQDLLVVAPTSHRYAVMDRSVVLNDYETFAQKLTYSVLAL